MELGASAGPGPVGPRRLAAVRPPTHPSAPGEQDAHDGGDLHGLQGRGDGEDARPVELGASAGPGLTQNKASRSSSRHLAPPVAPHPKPRNRPLCIQASPRAWARSGADRVQCRWARADLANLLLCTVAPPELQLARPRHLADLQFRQLPTTCNWIGGGRFRTRGAGKKDGTS